MHVITRKALRDFWKVYPPAEGPMSNWHAVVENATFASFASVRDTFNSADSVGGFVVFNVNSYRIVVDIHYNTGRIYIRHVLTHAEYERWSQTMRGRRKKEK